MYDASKHSAYGHWCKACREGYWQAADFKRTAIERWTAPEARDSLIGAEVARGVVWSAGPQASHYWVADGVRYHLVHKSEIRKSLREAS